MGLWNFVKDAGKSLFGGPAQASENALEQEIKDLGLVADDIKVSVDGDKVKLDGGMALSAEDKEKLILAVGNVEGVATVEADLTDEPVFHTVVKGDTLWAIASKTLGNGARYPEIFEANRPMLSDPDKIYPGQVLRIPQ